MARPSLYRRHNVTKKNWTGQCRKLRNLFEGCWTGQKHWRGPQGALEYWARPHTLDQHTDTGSRLGWIAICLSIFFFSPFSSYFCVSVLVPKSSPAIPFNRLPSVALYITMTLVGVYNVKPGGGSNSSLAHQQTKRWCPEYVFFLVNGREWIVEFVSSSSVLLNDGISPNTEKRTHLLSPSAFPPPSESKSFLIV